MKEMFDSVVDKFGPWVVALIMIGTILFESHRHEATLVEMNKDLTAAVQSLAEVHEAQTTLMARDGFILPPQGGPLPLP